VYDPNVAQKMDYILYRKKQGLDMLGEVITLGSASDYTHIARYIGDNKIIEWHAATGCVIVEINKDDYERIDIYRYYKTIMPWRLNRIYKYLLKKVAINEPYDFGDCANSITATLGRLLHWRWLAERKPIFKQNKKAHNCSTGQRHADRYGFVNSVPGVNVNTVTPGDFAKSKRLIRVS